MARSAFSLALALATAFVGHALCADDGHPAASRKPVSSAAAQSLVERALERQVSIKLKDSPLKEAAAYLADISGVNVLLDSKAIKDAGGREDQRISFELSNVSFGAALRMMLAEHELGYTILDDEVISITTREGAKDHAIVRAYYVKDLVISGDAANEFWEEDRDVDSSSLINVLTTCIHPEQWASNQPSPTYVAGTLVVEHNLEVQTDVRQLLAALRKVREAERSGSPPALVVIGTTSGDEKIREQLQRRQDFKFDEIKLAEFADELRKQGLSVYLDKKAIADAGVGLDAPLSLTANQVTLKFALRRMLGDQELNYFVQDGLLQITSAAGAKEHTRVGIYPVAGLVSEGPNDTLDFDTLTDTITSVVAPTSWPDGTGPGPISPVVSPCVLVIQQSDDVHEQISDVLAKLRAAKASGKEASPNANAGGKPAMVLRVHRVINGEETALDHYISVIRALIEPATWDRGAAYIAKLPGAIIVRHAPDVQKRIDNLIAEVQGLGIGGLGGGSAKPGVGGPFQVAAEKPDPKGGKAEAGEPAATEPTAVERALAKPVKIEFIETPLKDVAEKLSKQTGLNVLLDAKAINDAGGTVDMPITRQLAGISLKSALRLMLSEHELNFIDVNNSTLMITSAAVAKESFVTRTYEVHDLLRPASKNDPGSPFDDIIDAITGIVAPTSWNDQGGAGSIAPFDTQLVISQTREIHEEIADLLVTIRQCRDEPGEYRDGGPGAHSGPEAKIYESLQKTLDLDYNETPLKDVAQHLNMHGPVIQLDARAITDAGGSMDMPITFKVKNMRMETALREMLSQHELSYMIDHEVLLITSAAAAKEHVIMRLYAVGDLVVEPSAESPDDSASYGKLTEVIISTIAPTSWADSGGVGSIQAFRLSQAIVCGQTEEIHEEIAALLAKLRAYKRVKSASASGGDKPTGEPVTRFYRLVSDRAGTAEYITVIKELVEPSVWARKEAYIYNLPEGIVVRCSPKTHERIRELLTDVEALAPQGAAGSGTGIRKKGGLGGQGSGAF
jgi:hypothetical protein